MKSAPYRLIMMGHLSHLHRRVTGVAFAQENILRSQPWILDYLAENDGCIQRDLANRSHFDPASITSALVGMEEQGMIRRENVPGDKRALRVFLTDYGREKQRVVQRVLTEAENQALLGFTEEEKEKLDEFLHRIHMNLDKEGD